MSRPSPTASLPPLALLVLLVAGSACATAKPAVVPVDAVASLLGDPPAQQVHVHASGRLEDVPSPYARLRQVNVRIGAARLDDKGWGSLGRPAILALDYVEGIGSRWLGLEGGLNFLYDQRGTTVPDGTGGFDHFEEHLADFEFSAGLLLAPPPPEFLLRPYIGAGGSVIWTDIDSVVNDAVVTDGDTTFGGYVKGGLLFQVTEGTHIGFEARYLDTGAVTAGTVSRELDGWYLAVVFGASFDWLDPFSW